MIPLSHDTVVNPTWVNEAMHLWPLALFAASFIFHSAKNQVGLGIAILFRTVAFIGFATLEGLPAAARLVFFAAGLAQLIWEGYNYATQNFDT